MSQNQQLHAGQPKSGWFSGTLRGWIDRAPTRSRYVRDASLILILTIVYVAAAKLELSLAFLHAEVSPFRPSAGLAIAVLLLFGYRSTPAIFLGTFIAHAMMPISLAAAAGIATGNTLESLLAVFLLNRFVGPRSPLNRAADVLKFVLFAGIVSPIVGATIGSLSLCLTGAAAWSSFEVIWLTWWLGVAAGTLVIAPFLVSWFEKAPEQVPARVWVEAGLLLGSLLIVSMIVFSGFVPRRFANYSLGYLTIPFLLWAAFRFGQRGASLALVLLSGIAISATTLGFGPFVGVDRNESLLFLQVFIVAPTTAALFFAAIVAEYQRSVMDTTFLASIVESTDDAVFGKTREGIIVSWNKGAERIYGYQAHEIVGRSVSILMPPDCEPTLQQILQKVTRGERIERLETQRLRRDRCRIDVSVTISPIRDKRGRITGAATVGRDITERKRAEAERERLLGAEHAARLEAEEARKLSSELLVREKASRVEAEVANRAKDEFLALVSHELRTPLNAILGWVNILLGEGQRDDAIRVRGLEVIKRNAALQVQIIEDILDVSRIIAGKLRLDIRETELRPVILAAVASVQPATQEKGIRLLQQLDTRVEPVSGDPSRLQQIVWNLLSNAIKFTPTGGEVEIILEQSESSALITVRDSGEGISPEFLPYVFDRFRQADSTSTKRYSGLGLGLAIARELVELQGGKITAWSPGRNKGSVFTVTMPCVTTHEKSAGGPRRSTGLRASPGPAPSLAGVRILLVDDDADSLDMLATTLTLQGAETRSAHTVREAMEAFKSWRPDLLISDIGMPDEDGYVLIKKVRASEQPNQSRIPAIALTGFASEHEVERVLAAGYQVHLAKPVEPAHLVKTSAELTQRRGDATAGGSSTAV